MARGPSGREKGVFYSQTRRQGIPDPYIPRKGLKEPTVCLSCRAIYAKKRWVLDEALFFDIKKKKKFYSQKCPACRKIADKYAMGHVRISGSFVVEHRDEIISLLRSEERHAIDKNPLERIMKIEKRPNGLNVQTTTDSLAMRIGHVLSRAYKGKSKFNWKYGDKSLIVEWSREL